ncbi:MAG: hypothetical protein IH995_03985 [Proteobacteria bacterium]|nr:hypothetical protein [Pseudomonadota bacterium]
MSVPVRVRERAPIVSIS